MSKARPCPFCGNDLYEIIQTDPFGNFSVRCLDCAAEGGFGKTKARAIKNWNKRSCEDELSVALGRIRAIVGAHEGVDLESIVEAIRDIKNNLEKRTKERDRAREWIEDDCYHSERCSERYDFDIEPCLCGLDNAIADEE